MSNNLKLKLPQDASRINLILGSTYWSDPLGASKAKLRETLKVEGSPLSDLKTWLETH